MKKKILIIISVIVLLLIAILACGAIAYSSTSDYQNDKFPENTIINGVDCSGLTYDQSASRLTDAWNGRHIVITGVLNEKIASFTDFGCTYDILEKLQQTKRNYLLFAAANHYFHTPLSVNIPMVISDYDKAFKESVLASDFLNKETYTESRDAYVDMSDPNFPIIPEVYGTKPDTEKFFNDLLHHIQTGDLNFIFDDRNYYSMPSVTADDENLKKYQKYCRQYLSQKITYSLGEETFTIPPEQLDKLLEDDLSGKADEEAVADYVDQLANTYDNVGAERSFTTLSGKAITVQGGTYGWEIDREKETEQLIADINTHQDVTRKPVFYFESFGEYTKTMGDTYLDLDISKQVVKYYKDGSLAFSASCVTGCRVNGTTTNTGTYYILNKVRNVVLRGDNVDGTRYESPVKYWMGVTWGGQGFHDADWRRAFGGSIWIRNGSHGCINMPPSQMPSLYNMVEVGTPVVMHY